MKHFSLLSAAVLAGAASLFGASRSPMITNVEPPYWWVGMATDTLQVMVTGPGIAKAEVNIDYPGVRLVEQTALESPNYKLLYFVIGRDTKPGTMDIDFKLGKRSESLPYQLKARERAAADYKGFDASDVLYLLMPDRFASDGKPGADASSLEYNPAVDRNDPNGRHGGNIAGVRRHLDYMDSLGVTALWLCPVLENDMPGGSYHGYATTNYYRIDPRFGTNEEYQALISEAHDKGLKVVMDMIFNHSGSNHPWMKDMPSRDWFNHPDGDVLTNFRLTTIHDPYVSDYDFDKTANGWFVTAMPDLNQRNPHLKKYLTQNSIWWIESSKIDGIRMDTYPYADMDAMSDWARDVLREYPGFNIVGECWYANEAGSAFWQSGSKINPKETHLPTVMDFWYIQNGREAFNSQTDPWSGLNKVYDHLAQDFLYADPQHVLTFLDNHDSDRFLASMPVSVDSLGVWKQAQTLLLTSRGIPQIYYGTELLMNGSKEGSDGYVRRDFPGGFPGDKVNAFTAEGRSDVQNEAWNFLSKLLNWRKGEANPVIAKGKLKHFMPQNGVYAYERRLGDRAVVVLMNGNDAPLDVTMERTAEVLPYGSKWTDILTGTAFEVPEKMTMKPREILVLQNW